MMNAIVDLQRLVKLAGMFGSDYPGERANAAAAADKMLRAQGLTWQDVIRAPSPGQARGQSGAGDFPHWRTAAQYCMQNYPALTAWELEFCTRLSGYRGMPSGKQLDVLRRLVERCRESAA